MPTQLFSGSREWLADYERIKVKRDALAQEYGATYPKIVAQLVDLFGRAEAVEKEVLRINGSAPDGESRGLLSGLSRPRAVSNVLPPPIRRSPWL